MACAISELPGSSTAPDSLSIDRIRRELASNMVGGHIYLFGHIASATEVLARLAEAGAREGTVVVADEGLDLRLSVLFRLDGALGSMPVLSCLAGRALGEALRTERVPAAVRIECATVAHRADWAILGIGVNFGAIAGVALQGIDRNAFAASFLNALDHLFATYAAGGASAVLAGWRDDGGIDARE